MSELWKPSREMEASEQLLDELLTIESMVLTQCAQLDKLEGKEFKQKAFSLMLETYRLKQEIFIKMPGLKWSDKDNRFWVTWYLKRDFEAELEVINIREREGKDQIRIK